MRHEIYETEEKEEEARTSPHVHIAYFVVLEYERTLFLSKSTADFVDNMVTL